MNQVRGKQKAAQDLSSLFIVDSNSVKQNRKRLRQSSSIVESLSTEGSDEHTIKTEVYDVGKFEPKRFRKSVTSFEQLKKDDVGEEETKSTYASRVLGCNAAIINNVHVSKNRRGFKNRSQSYRAPRMQSEKEIKNDKPGETKKYTDTKMGLESTVESILSTAPEKPVSPLMTNICKSFETSKEELLQGEKVDKNLRRCSENGHQIKRRPSGDTGEVQTPLVSKSSSPKMVEDGALARNANNHAESNFCDEISFDSTRKPTYSFTSAKMLHDQVKFDDTRWLKNFDKKEKARRRRNMKNCLEKFSEWEAEYVGVKYAKLTDSINQSSVLNTSKELDVPASCSTNETREKRELPSVDLVDRVDEMKFGELGVVTDFKDTYMDVSFLSESQYMPLVSPSPVKSSCSKLKDVTETSDNVEVCLSAQTVKRNLMDQLIDDACERNTALLASPPEMNHPKKFVFKSTKSKQREEIPPDGKNKQSIRFCNNLTATGSFECVDNTRSVESKTYDVVDERYEQNKEPKKVDQFEDNQLSNDGRKVVSSRFGNKNPFKTPRQKNHSLSEKSPEVDQTNLKIHEVLDLSGSKIWTNSLSIGDSLINRNMLTLQDYKQNLLNQAVTFSKLAIIPAYAVFYQQHFPEYLKRDAGGHVRQSPENFFSRLGYLTFSGLKLLKNSLQHNKIVSKLMQTRHDNCFYIGFPAEKYIFNKFNKNDIWVIILDRSLMTNSGIDDPSMKILLVRSMMPWPLWNGHMQVQVIAALGNQSSDLMGDRKTNDMTLKSLFGLNCFNSSYCAIRISQAVNDMDCVSCIQDCFPNSSGLESRPECIPGLFGSLCNPTESFQNATSSSGDELIDSRNVEKALSLAEKVAKNFHLNENQSKALLQFCSSLCSVESSNLTTLIHGVFGSGKSYLLAVLAHFIMKLIDQDLLLDPNFSLLICSGTNIAVDNVLIKYLDIAFRDQNVSDDVTESDDPSSFDEHTMQRVLRIGNVQKIAIPILKYSLHSDVISDTTKQLNLRLKNENLRLKEREALLKLRLSEKHVGRENRVMCAKIVGVTCASCLSPHLNPFKASVLIIDEASQLTECMTHLAISRFKPKRLVLVGDPKQLPPVLPDAPSTRKPLLKDRNVSSIAMETTLFQRLMTSGIEPILLNEQYRCHPKISRLCNDLFYGATLQDAVGETDRESLIKVNNPKDTSLSNVILVNISNGLEQLNNNSSCKSLINVAEADFCCQLVVHAVNSQNIAPADIGVICFYRAQVSLITEKLTMAFSNLGVTTFDDVTMPFVSTIDAFQGGERKMIVLCTTRTKSNNIIPSLSNDRTDDNLEFFSNSNRLNVALSRAKNNLILLCNLSLIIATSALERSNVWLDLYELIGKHGAVYKNVQQLASLLGMENLSPL